MNERSFAESYSIRGPNGTACTVIEYNPKEIPLEVKLTGDVPTKVADATKEASLPFLVNLSQQLLNKNINFLLPMHVLISRPNIDCLALHLPITNN